MKIITLNELNEFQDFIINNIKRDSYEYKYLINCLDLVFTYQKLPISPNSKIIHNNDKWIIYIETQSTLFFYGEKYDELEDVILDGLNLDQYKGKEIMGEYDLVYSLLKKSGITDYEIIKDRLFYKTSNLNKIEICDYEIAVLNDMEEIILLFQNYYEEEYNGKRNKNKEDLQGLILQQIKDEEIYIIKRDYHIVSFCSLNNPDIGIMYTMIEYRNKGYGKQLFYAVAQKLLLENSVIYVMTDMHNNSSNKISEDVGFNIFYRHTNIKL